MAAVAVAAADLLMIRRPTALLLDRVVRAVAATALAVVAVAAILTLMGGGMLRTLMVATHCHSFRMMTSWNACSERKTTCQ